jgi:tetratricopeptide (TPR) repeat protein
MKLSSRSAFFALAMLALGATGAAANDNDVCDGNGGDLDKLIAACNRVIASHDSTRVEVGSAYINRGQHYYQKGDNDRAIQDFDKAIAMNAKWIMLAYEDRGNAYYVKREYQTAIDSYTKAIELFANYPGAYAGRGLAYEQLGVPDKALADFRSAISVANSPFSDDEWARKTAHEHLDKQPGHKQQDQN